MNMTNPDEINPEIRKAGLALALWLEDNLFGFVCPQLIEAEGPAIRLCTLRPEPQKGWIEFFPARALPPITCGISVRFRALNDGETVSPDRQGIEINGIRFVVEIYTTLEERFLVIRITDPKHRLIAKPVSDEDPLTETLLPLMASPDEVERSGSVLKLSGLPYFRDFK